jgi:hypothetical protein
MLGVAFGVGLVRGFGKSGCEWVIRRLECMEWAGYLQEGFVKCWVSGELVAEIFTEN